MEVLPMRFSLKWVLAGVTYVAVAAAAFSQTTWVYADLLWAASLLAVVYAVLVACFARGRRQAAAAGFVAASVCFLVCSHFANDSVPTRRLLAAAGVGQNLAPSPYYAPSVVSRPVVETISTPAGPVKRTRTVEVVVQQPVAAPTPVAPMAGPTTVSQWMAQSRIAPPSPYVDFSIYMRAASAVGMMLFGGVGCALGMLAYKAARREAGAAQQIAPGQ
jgi:hypothetical protein